MSEAIDRFRLDYAPLLQRYLSRRDEVGLQAAYELGRASMHVVGLLDVVKLHHEVLSDVLATVDDVHEVRDLVDAATTLLLDLVACFEMSQRGFMDASGRSSSSPSEAKE
jgi:hypothetical protein